MPLITSYVTTEDMYTFKFNNIYLYTVPYGALEDHMDTAVIWSSSLKSSTLAEVEVSRVESSASYSTIFDVRLAMAPNCLAIQYFLRLGQDTYSPGSWNTLW